MTVLGEGVGKSSLVLRFIKDAFVEYDPTIEDSYYKQVTLDNEICLFDILDTSGEKETSAMRDDYMRNSDAFLLCFSVTCRKSFETLIAYRDQIFREKDEIWPIFIVACKCDLEISRVVSIHEIEDLSKSFAFNGCSFIETSAKDNFNVEKAFFDSVREFKKFRKAFPVDTPKKRRKIASYCNLDLFIYFILFYLFILFSFILFYYLINLLYFYLFILFNYYYLI